MAVRARARLVPPKPAAGEIVEVTIVIAHPMESGFRVDDGGQPIPQNIIHSIACRYNGREVFRARLGTGLAATPQFVFHTRARESGELVFEWTDDRNAKGELRLPIDVA